MPVHQHQPQPRGVITSQVNGIGPVIHYNHFIIIKNKMGLIF